MTNGEKIQQDFACELCEPIIEDDIIHVIFADKKDSAIGFDWSWWNAEYKEPTTKNDLGVDCISRDAVKYYIQAHIHEIITESGIDKNAHTNRILRALLNGVDTMPSVTPQEPKTGHWIKFPVGWKCSNCSLGTNDRGADSFNFCPNCGAKMAESEG